jgi:hypothetical protein
MVDVHVFNERREAMKIITGAALSKSARTVALLAALSISNAAAAAERERERVPDAPVPQLFVTAATGTPSAPVLSAPDDGAFFFIDQPFDIKCTNASGCTLISNHLIYPGFTPPGIT